MENPNVVARAQYGAVKAKYGTANKNTSYEMKTKQHLYQHDCRNTGIGRFQHKHGVMVDSNFRMSH